MPEYFVQNQWSLSGNILENICMGVTANQSNVFSHMNK